MSQSVFSFSRSKGEFLIPHSEHREVFWPRWVCSAPSSSALLYLAPRLRIWKNPNQHHCKKRHENSPFSCLEFLWNDTTENWIKFVAIDMQMLQSFTASGQSLHFHVGFAHKYVYYPVPPLPPEWQQPMFKQKRLRETKPTNKWRLMKQALPIPCFWFFSPSAIQRARAKQDPRGRVCGRPIWFSAEVPAAGFPLRNVSALTWREQRSEPSPALPLPEPGDAQREGSLTAGEHSCSKNILQIAPAVWLKTQMWCIWYY